MLESLLWLRVTDWDRLTNEIFMAEPGPIRLIFGGWSSLPRVNVACRIAQVPAFSLKHFPGCFVFIAEGNEELHVAERKQNDELTQTTACIGRPEESYARAGCRTARAIGGGSTVAARSTEARIFRD